LRGWLGGRQPGNWLALAKMDLHAFQRRFRAVSGPAGIVRFGHDQLDHRFGGRVVKKRTKPAIVRRLEPR
jgi:hypothetical protein